METFDPRIDIYIDNASDFAKPILNHIRKIVHQAHPDITETIKWSMPFFDYKGTVCQMAAFKQHCAFGFWKAGRLTDPHKVLNKGEEASAGSFGRINTLADLPSDKILIEYILEAIQLNEGNKITPRTDKPKPVKTIEKKEIPVPEEFITQLDANPTAEANFNKFSLSKQNEYLTWFAEAKTEATKLKRIEQAMEWINEGKSRHWKYQS